MHSKVEANSGICQVSFHMFCRWIKRRVTVFGPKLLLLLVCIHVPVQMLEY